MTVTPKTVKDLIKGASRQRRKTRINLAGNLMVELEQLEDELLQLEIAEDTKPDSAKTKRLTDKSPLLLKAQEIEAKRVEMADYWLDLVVEQKPFVEWRQWKATHPARDGEPFDDSLGVNFDILVTEFTPTCVVEPDLDADDWKGIFDKAAPGDLRDLGALVFRVHEARMDVPLVPTALRLIAMQDGKSKQPGTSG